MLKKTVILSLSLALLFSVGCTQDDNRANLDAQIEKALDNKDLKDVDADVEENGRVVLSGNVENAQQKSLAEQTTREIRNVKQIDNIIKVDYDEPDQTANQPVDKTPNDNLANKKADNTNDSWIAFKTKLALYADNRVAGTDVDVESNNGEVTLLGKVPTPKAKQAAIEVAIKIDGVKTVNNELQIVPASKREAVNDKDETITDNVETILDNDAALKDLDLTVTTNNGVVTLTGEAESIAQVDKAITSVRNVKGVKAVNAHSVVIKDQQNNSIKKGSY